MIGQDIVDRAARTVMDPDTVRWPGAEWLLWINDGQKQIALHRPDANPKNAIVTLGVGTKQTIPADGSRLLRVVRNRAGTTEASAGGRAIREMSREALDNELPEWHSTQDSGAILQYTFDNIDPKHYYVYPGVKAASTRHVEIVYLAIPADVPDLNTMLDLGDEWRAPLVDYCLFRGYAKDADYAGNMQRAAAYLAAFGNDLGVKLNINFAAALPPNRPRGDESGAARGALV